MNLNLKRTIKTVIAGAAICGMLAGCGKEMQTYEFETYDGATVVIDASNIATQEANDNALEWSGLPEDAEQMAPGRDFILFADDENYYVEDVANGLITVATK